MMMRVACVSLFVVAAVGPLAVDAAGQSGQRTPWGDPDLQGAYSFKTTTPLQRPESVGDKEFLTAEEVAAQEQAVIPDRKSLRPPPSLPLLTEQRELLDDLLSLPLGRATLLNFEQSLVDIFEEG